MNARCEGALDPRRRRWAFLLLALVLVQARTVWADGDSTGQPPHERCAYCHELDGNSRTERLPRLAGQRPEYLAKQLRDFRSGARDSSMQATAELLSDPDMAEVARHFSRQPVLSSGAPAPGGPAPVEPGPALRLNREGDAARHLRACAGCHGRDGEGRGVRPRLAGQHAAYLQTQLVLFRDGKRANDDVMRAIAAALTDSEIQSLSRYFATLGAR